MVAGSLSRIHKVQMSGNTEGLTPFTADAFQCYLILEVSSVICQVQDADR